MDEEAYFSERSHRNHHVKEQLSRVYTNGNGSLPDMTRLERQQTPFWKKMLYSLTAIFAVILIASAAGFIYFGNLGNDSFTNQRVVLKIEPPISLNSDQDALYTVTITNNEKVDLYSGRLEIIYPENFKLIESSPKSVSEQKNAWDFSLIKKGETAKIEIKGRIIAPLDSIQTFRGSFSFKPANMNSEFRQETITEAKVAGSNLQLSVTGPEKASPGQIVEYTINYKNISTSTLENWQIIADYPSGFVFSSATPETQKDNISIWSLPKIASSSEGKIVLKGSYSGNNGGPTDFKVRGLFNYNGDYILQSQGSATTEVAKNSLSLQLIVNGKSDNQTINFSDLLTYTLNFKNAGEETLKNIKITANFDSDILDWNTLEGPKKSQVNNNTITWTGSDLSQLNQLSAGQEGTISWQVKVKDNSALKDNKVIKYSVDTYIDSSFYVGNNSTSESIKTPNITNTINSDLNIGAEVRYYNEDNMPLGSGPIQPSIGQSSTYNIKVTLSNSLQNSKNIRIVANLPKNVKWTGKENHDLGDLVYDSRNNKISWIISKLPKNSGDSLADFNLTVKPTENDAGKVLILISDMTLSATNSETSAEITKSIKAVTTSFNDPVVGRVSGVVE